MKRTAGAILSLVLLAAPIAAEAQQTRVYRVGVILQGGPYLAAIEGLTTMPRLLALIAARAASLLNVADLSRGSGLPHSTLARYLALLERSLAFHLARLGAADLVEDSRQ